MSPPAGSHLRQEDRRRFEDALVALPSQHGRLERWLRVVLSAAGRIVDWRLDVTGMETLPPGRGGRLAAGCIVVAAPHRAWVEPFLLFAAWPGDAARLVWLADGRTVTRSWWRKRLLPHVGIIPVRGDLGGPRAYAELAALVLESGAALVVFPEVGPPSPPDRTRRISPGFAYLARRSGAPVVPIVVGGTHRIMRGSHFSLQVCAPLAPGVADPDPFRPPGRRTAHVLAERYQAVVSAVLPALTARADALAPERERWTWLARLFR